MQALDTMHGQTIAAGDRYPISRWYARPCAELVADVLVDSALRPSHVTFVGLLCGLSAAASLVVWPTGLYFVAMLVWLSWFCDRLDGALARRQRTTSAWGAWFDANADELVDLGIHAAVAYAATAISTSQWPWILYLAFVFGKYQLMHGLSTERDIVSTCDLGDSPLPSKPSHAGTWISRLYHLPANADVRLHLLIVGLLTGWLQTELLLLALYYNFRWLARIGLVAARLRGVAR